MSHHRKLFANLLLIALLILGLRATQFARWATAAFNDQQALGNNAIAAVVLGAPSNLSGTPQGHDISLSWDVGQNGTGYEILGAANGASSNCSGAGYSAIDTTSGITYSDIDRYAPQGNWFCYQVKTINSTWSSTQSNPVVAVQLGFFANSLQLINDGNHSGCLIGTYGTSGALDCGDQVVITFNQAVDTTSGPVSGNTVCAHQASGTIWLGSTTSTGACTGSESDNLGKLTGGTITGCDCRFNAVYTWSNGNKQLVVTVGALVSGIDVPLMSSATWTFTPTTNASKMFSATGGVHICDNNSGGGDCLPSDAASAFGVFIPPPSFTPTPSPTTTPSATPSPSATESDTPTSTTTLMPSDTYAATATSTIEESPTETPSPTMIGGTPTDTASPTNILDTPTPTSTPTPTPTLDISPTETPSPTP